MQESLRAQLTSMVETLSEKYTSLKTYVSGKIDSVKASVNDKKAEALGASASLRAGAEKAYNAAGDLLRK